MKKKLISMLLIVVLMFTMIPAAFAAGPYNVTYDANGGDSGTMAAEATNADGKITLSSNKFEKSGYTFDKWNTAADGSGTSYGDGATVTLEDHVTLYAQWKINTYTINYVLDGGTNGAANPTEYTAASATITINDPTKDGYKFLGWTSTELGLSSPTKSVSFPGSTAANVTLTAVWEADSSSEGGEEGGGEGGSGGSGGTPVIEVNGKAVDPSIAKTVQESSTY